MLTRLAVKNFKSIGDPGVDLELRPLTFLVGKNGAGKSSALEALALVAQSLGMGSPNWGGDLVKYDDFLDVVHKRDANGSITTVLEMVAPDAARLSLSCEITFRNGGFHQYLQKPTPEQAMANIYLTIKDHVFLLRSARGIEMGKVQPRPLTINWVGPQGEYLLYVLSVLYGPEGNQQAGSDIEHWAKIFEVDELIPGYTSAADLRISYRDSNIGTKLPGSSTSYGSRQVLPIIVQIFWSEPGSVIMIEEPEISLHPQAQVDMAELLATAVARGKQIIATTHSTFLLMGLTSAVQKKIIKPQDVVVYELEKGAKGTKVNKKLDMNKKGVIKGWVDSFSEVDKRLLREWTATLPKV